MTPTQRTLKHLRDQGYTAAVCEKWNPHARIRQDLFGCLDIIAINGQTREILGVQCTSGSGYSRRVQKLRELPIVTQLSKAGMSVEVWGWRKLKTGWQVKRYYL